MKPVHTGWLLLLGATVALAVPKADAPDAYLNVPAAGNIVAVPVSTPGDVFLPPPIIDIPQDKAGDMIKLGRLIFTDTPRYARRFTGNALSCSNCHLSEGRKPGAAPLWAAWGMYPMPGNQPGEVWSFEARIQGCFRYSQNGQGPQLDSPEMTALVAYAQWLSTGAPARTELAGRGMFQQETLAGGAPTPASKPVYSVSHGQKVYQFQCAACHGADGLGVTRKDNSYQFPPLWGQASYGGGSPLAQVPKLALFVRANMPLGRGGSLSETDANDVAAYILSKPRPSDPRIGWRQRWREARK
ncbi:MAG: c-type cytochrome [Thiobacillaceae bacterium]